MLQIHKLFSLFPVQVPFWRYRCASRATFFSPLSSELCIEVIHPFCIGVLTKHVNGVALNTRVVNHNFRNALILHYNFWENFTSSSNLFYERCIYCFSTHSHRGFKPAQFECILRAMQCVLSALCAKVEVAENNACGRTTASQVYIYIHVTHNNVYLNIAYMCDFFFLKSRYWFFFSSLWCIANCSCSRLRQVQSLLAGSDEHDSGKPDALLCILGIDSRLVALSSPELKETSRRFFIFLFSYLKVYMYKLITMGTKFKNLWLSGGEMTMFSKFITNYIEQGWWHSSFSLKCMH